MAHQDLLLGVNAFYDYRHHRILSLRDRPIFPI